MNRQYFRYSKALLGAILALTLLASASTPEVGKADPSRYLADVKVLASPDMEGRGPGTKGIVKASNYIEARYKSLGLKPAGTDGYLQPFTVTTGAKLKSGNELTVEESGRKQTLALQSGLRALQLFLVGHSDRSAGVCRIRRDRAANSTTTTTPAWM